MAPVPHTNLVVRAGGDFGLLEASRAVRGRGRPRHIDLLIFVLQLVELVVDAALGQEFLMRAHFADLSLVHNDDFVSALHCREAVGDDQRGAAFDHAIEGVADFEFRLRVHAGGGFVEDQDFGIVRQSAGEGDELLLSGRKS